jgi:hypothetical protein
VNHWPWISGFSWTFLTFVSSFLFDALHDLCITAWTRSFGARYSGLVSLLFFTNKNTLDGHGGSRRVYD